MNYFKSQCGEDQWIAEHWDELGLPDLGFFVEFGAADGIGGSNTYWLEKEKGWSGLLIEPDFRHEISDRDNCIIERCAVGNLGSISLGLTENPFLSGELRGTPEADSRIAPAIERVEVNSVPLDCLLDEHKIERVDLISIDTEGTELEAWCTLDLKRWRPQVAIIELDAWGLPDISADIIERLQSDGYELLHTTKYNGIFKSTI